MATIAVSDWLRDKRFQGNPGKLSRFHRGDCLRLHPATNATDRTIASPSPLALLPQLSSSLASKKGHGAESASCFVLDSMLAFTADVVPVLMPARASTAATWAPIVSLVCDLEDGGDSDEPTASLASAMALLPGSSKALDMLLFGEPTTNSSSSTYVVSSPATCTESGKRGALADASWRNKRISALVELRHSGETSAAARWR